MSTPSSNGSAVITRPGADHVAIQAVTPDPARALEELQLRAPAC
jgi:hypothetical protein